MIVSLITQQQLPTVPPFPALRVLLMSTTDGYCSLVQELTLYNNEEKKNIRGLSAEYIWKLLSMLPPIPDVPPPGPKKAFFNLVPLQALKKTKERIVFLSKQENLTEILRETSSNNSQ